MRSALLLAAALLAALNTTASARPDERRPIEAIVNRITWGQTSESVADAKKLGVDQWINAQLRAGSQATLSPPVQSKIDALKITQTPMASLVIDIDAQNKATEKIADPTARQAARRATQEELQDLRREATTRSLLRDLYSPNQLREKMTWFWYNHFNVQADKRDIRAMVGDYEDQAIRPHALGKFKDLLKAADLHPAMLRYLDNDQNAVGHVNENFAREILELHTLGVGAGYTQKDVEEMARILTGVGISLSPDPPNLNLTQKALLVRRGIMEFNPSRHDFGEKWVFGSKVTGAGLSEFENILDFLSHQPATAKYISGKMARYFMDDPSPALIDQMASTFHRSEGDIADVLSVLLRSKEFEASLGKKIKDPIHYAVSAVRLTYDGRSIDSTAPLQTWISQMGQPLYGRETPDGYPIEAAAWSGSGQLMTMFEVGRQIGSLSSGLIDPARGAATAQLENATFQAVSKGQLSERTRAVLSQARSPIEWNALFLSSPEFLYR